MADRKPVNKVALGTDEYTRVSLLMERVATLVRAADDPADEREAGVLHAVIEEAAEEVDRILERAERIRA